MGKLSELSLWGGRRASHNEARGKSMGKMQGEPTQKNRGHLGRCSWTGSLMVPPTVIVIQGLPSLIYICEPCHSHLQAFV